MSVYVYLDTDEKIAHHPNMRMFLRARAEKIAARARVFLDARSEERTGRSHVITSSGKLDAYVSILDVPPAGTKDPDKVAAIISYQHNVLWDAVKGG